MQEPVNDDFDWLVLPADSQNNIGGPIYDHTHMAFDGLLIYCNQSEIKLK